MMNCPEPFDLLAQEVKPGLFVSERQRKRPEGNNAIGMEILRPEQVGIDRRLAEDLVSITNQLAGGKAGSTRPSNGHRYHGMGNAGGMADRGESRSFPFQIAQYFVDVLLEFRRRLKSVLCLLGEHLFQ